VDTVERVLLALPQIHRAGADRIVRAAFHPDAALQLRHVLPQLGLARQHFRWRIPVGPFLLGVHGRHARPDEPLGADPDTVADGLSAALYQIEEMTSRIDDDRALRFGRWISHDRSRECRVGSVRLFRRGAVETEPAATARARRVRPGRRAAGEADQGGGSKTAGNGRAPVRQSRVPRLHACILAQNLAGP
jgi:hypothetical protein